MSKKNKVTEKDLRVFAILIIILALSIALLRFREASADSEYSGNAGVSLTINYVDGTKKVIDPTEPFYLLRNEIIPGSVVDPDVDKEVSSLGVAVKIRADWSGEVERFALTGSMQTYVDDEPTGGPVLLNKVPSNLPNNEWVEILKVVYSSDELTAFNPEVGTHIAEVEADISLTLFFEDDTKDKKDGLGQASWLYEIKDQGPDPGEPEITLFEVKTDVEVMY